MNDPLKVIGRIRPSWNSAAMLIRGKLTDKKIEQYRKRGYYDAEWRKARSDYWKRRQFRRRSGDNFMEVDGRLVYNPL